MELMARHESGPLFEGHVVCVSDNQTEIPAEITLMATFIEGSISGYVCILRDKSDEQELEAAVQREKRQSEDLLHQILPEQIIAPLNAPTAFKIDCATVIFIDIAKFSQYSSNLTPQEIFSNLATVFLAFDDAIKRYQTLTKIKVIGDVYFCAGGVFDQDERHDRDGIRFALDILRIIDELNEKLNSALSLRIGLNTGGPIIGGVVTGKDRGAAFDIYGKTVNDTIILQRASAPGCIHISEETYARVSDLNLGVGFRERNDVELKGTGKVRTYMIDAEKAAEDTGAAP